MVKLMSKGQQYPRISVVIPALNEAQNLQYVLSSIPPIMSEAVLVDGHATNDAIDLARRTLTTIQIVKQA
jgi:cellulose synthase/poly-beta-1,6-N-acetylglucosamine synthase-like glycosyltransferase